MITSGHRPPLLVDFAIFFPLQAFLNIPTASFSIFLYHLIEFIRLDSHSGFMLSNRQTIKQPTITIYNSSLMARLWTIVLDQRGAYPTKTL